MLKDFESTDLKNVAFKGGIPRRILRMMFQLAATDDKGFDIDLIAFTSDSFDIVDENETMKTLTQLTLGGIPVLPVDVEISTIDEMLSYFLTRDVCQNEVLLWRKQSPPHYTLESNSNLGSYEHEWMLFYTDGAARDIINNVVTPSVHGLHGTMRLIWDIDSEGRPYLMDSFIARTMIRLYKGDGIDVIIPEDTNKHYKQYKLTDAAVYQILKPIHADTAKYRFAVDDLISRQWIHPTNADKLWGTLLMSMNNTCIKARKGRLTMEDQSIEQVKSWKLKKYQELRESLSKAVGIASGYVASTEVSRLVITLIRSVIRFIRLIISKGLKQTYFTKDYGQRLDLLALYLDDSPGT
ncbi:hypothetical protein HDU86_000566 [Geranomyces michiganensis]|nr:hypothetical protein HDU86_000566 [Geranomyces michiganensis]